MPPSCGGHRNADRPLPHELTLSCRMRADAHNGHRLPFETESKPLVTVALAAQSASTVHLVSVDYFSHGPLRPCATVNKFVPRPALQLGILKSDSFAGRKSCFSGRAMMPQLLALRILHPNPFRASLTQKQIKPRPPARGILHLLVLRDLSVQSFVSYRQEGGNITSSCRSLC